MILEAANYVNETFAAKGQPWVNEMDDWKTY